MFAALTLTLQLASLASHSPQEPTDPLAHAATRTVVLIFVSTDCPIANRYAPEIQRLHRQFSPQGARFWLVYPEPTESPETIREHLSAFGYQLEALRDPDRRLVRASKVRVTPEAAVFTAGRLVYHGRIDDRYVDVGRARPSATTRDLESVLRTTLDGRPAPHTTAPAIGCLISTLK